MRSASWRGAVDERLPFTRDQRRVLYAICAAILLFIIGQIVRPGFGSAQGIESVLVVASFVGFVAAGQMFVILIGGIDLSVPWVLNAAAIVVVTVTRGSDGLLLLGLAATLGTGALVGLINGIGIARFRVPAVVMTLAMNGIMEGLTLGQSGGMTCETCASYAPPLVQLAVHGHLLGVPAVLYVWLLVILVVSFVLSSTTFGRATYAVGNSALVSYLAGLRVNGVTIALYTLSGILFGARGDNAGRFRRSGGPGDGRPLSLSVYSCGGNWRGVHLRRPRKLCWYSGRSGDAGRPGQCAAGIEHA
jgi:ribose transport system permease protein